MIGIENCGCNASPAQRHNNGSRVLVKPELPEGEALRRLIIIINARCIISTVVPSLSQQEGHDNHIKPCKL